MVHRAGAGDAAAVGHRVERVEAAAHGAARLPDRVAGGQEREPLLEHALRGFAGVRAYAVDPEASAELFEQRLGFERVGDDWRVAGEARRATYGFDPAPEARGLAGAGTVHHVAWASPDADHEAWLQVAREAGRRPSPVLDRSYFRSIYFREPSGVLFEIATLSPGFGIDEPVESLGESLRLPPQFEPRRAAIETSLIPIGTRRQAARR